MNLREFKHEISAIQPPCTIKSAHNDVKKKKTCIVCFNSHHNLLSQNGTKIQRKAQLNECVGANTSEEDLQVGWQRARSQDCSCDLRASYIHHHMFSEWEQVYQLNEPLRHMWGGTGGGGAAVAEWRTTSGKRRKQPKEKKKSLAKREEWKLGEWYSSRFAFQWRILCSARCEKRMQHVPYGGVDSETLVKSHLEFNKKAPNQRLCAEPVIKSIKRLSSSSKSLT